MDQVAEVLRHLLSNDHGELTALVAFITDHLPWLQVQLQRWRGGAR